LSQSGKFRNKPDIYLLQFTIYWSACTLDAVASHKFTFLAMDFVVESRVELATRKMRAIIETLTLQLGYTWKMCPGHLLPGQLPTARA
jgi:hypothetical protein